MPTEFFLLIIIVVTALAFDFTNGFHDTGNAMATSIATGALRPKVAVALSAVMNLIGAFLSTAVAATIAKGLVDSHLVTLELAFAGLVGGIVWNLVTWLLGIPSSSSHALIGGIVGAMIAAVGAHGVIWKGLVSNVIAPAVLSPLIAGLVATIGTWLVYRAVRGVPEKRTNSGFRYGQIGSASLVSLAHGTNDAQKTMGVIFLALISYGAVSSTQTMPPLWVIVSCAAAIAAGTYVGGWRVIRTLGKGFVDIQSPQGMAAECSSAAIILLSSHFGYSLSTTHVATGSILGSGVGKPRAKVRWGLAGRMAAAWLITLPSAALVGAITYVIVHAVGGYDGAAIGFALLVALSAAIWLRSRQAPVDSANVNEEWEGGLTPPSVTGATGAEPASTLVDAPQPTDPKDRHHECIDQLPRRVADPRLRAAGRCWPAGAVRGGRAPQRRRWVCASTPKEPEARVTPLSRAATPSSVPSAR